MSDSLEVRIIKAIKKYKFTYDACFKLTYNKMVHDEDPPTSECLRVMQAAAHHTGGYTGYLDNKAVDNLWRHVFGALVEDVLADLNEHPLGAGDMARIHKKYKKEARPVLNHVPPDPYDDVVEDLYLTAVNDQETYKICMKEVQKLMFICKRKLPARRVKHLLSPSNDTAVSTCTTIQLVNAWLKIFDHLQEAAIYELEHDCLCSAGELKAIKCHYIPGYNQEEVNVITNVKLDGTVTPWVDMSEELLREIEEHTQKAQQHFDAVNQSLLEIKMNNQLKNSPFTTVSYVYGNDIEELNAQDLMDGIKRAKREIAEVTAADIKSDYVEKTVAGLNKAIDKMVARLDTL